MYQNHRTSDFDFLYSLYFLLIHMHSTYPSNKKKKFLTNNHMKMEEKFSFSPENVLSLKSQI